jgi:hypothetical protein
MKDCSIEAGLCAIGKDGPQVFQLNLDFRLLPFTAAVLQGLVIEILEGFKAVLAEPQAAAGPLCLPLLFAFDGSWLPLWWMLKPSPPALAGRARFFRAGCARPRSLPPVP